MEKRKVYTFSYLPAPPLPFPLLLGCLENLTERALVTEGLPQIPVACLIPLCVSPIQAHPVCVQTPQPRGSSQPPGGPSHVWLLSPFLC